MDDQEPPCDVAGGPLWHSLDSQDNWKTLTNFHCYQLLSFFGDLQPLLGPKTTYSRPKWPKCPESVGGLQAELCHSGRFYVHQSFK